MVFESYGPSHWESLYREGRTPWDAGGTPRDLEDWLAENPPGGRALVPGCGTGYEAARLADAGMSVIAIDFSPAAVARAKTNCRRSGARILEADFFDADLGCFDLIYERAFLCALPPRLRETWARRCAGLLVPGGLLVGLFFTDPTAQDGPPFGISTQELSGLLSPEFHLRNDRSSGGSLPVFEGRERWQVWERCG
jgi:SAM-dependent methyltransferase